MWPAEDEDPLDAWRVVLACGTVAAVTVIAVLLIEFAGMRNGAVGVQIVGVLMAIAVAGARAGLVALAAALVATWYFVLDPRYSFGVDGWSTVASLAALGIGGLIALTLYGRERAARARGDALLVSLRESERHWRNLTESIPALVSESTTSGRFLYVGERWTAYTGMDVDELMGHPMRVCHPDDRARVAEAFAGALRRGQADSAEWRIRAADGTYRWHLGFVAPIRDDNDVIASWAIASIDIDESKRVGDALRGSEERYRQLADSIDAMIVVADERGTFTFANDRFYAYAGFSRGAVPGDPFTELLHPEDARAAVANWRETIAGGIPRAGEFRLRGADGAYRWHLARVTPIGATDSEPRSFILTLVNIDALKETEEALVESEDRYRTLADVLPVLIVSTRQDGEYEYCNDSYFEYTGLTLDAARRRPDVSVIHPDDEEQSARMWEHALTTGEPFVNEMRLRRFDGDYRWHLVRGNPMRRRDGTIERWLTVSMDVHERKLSEQERERLVRELEQANAAQDEFLGLMSHELKTPITTIAGNAEVLDNRADLLDEESRKGALHDIRRDTARLHRIIENLLLLARISQGGIIDAEPILVGRIVERIIAEHRQQNPHREIALDSRGHAMPVIASDLYIEQVVRNLLSNAEKYSPAHEPISVVIDREHGEIAVRVLDCGVGVGAQEAEEIFTPFYRSSKTSHYTPGMGIGLAVCKRLIETHGGRIWVAARADGGSEFGFSLPALSDDGDDHDHQPLPQRDDSARVAEEAPLG